MPAKKAKTTANKSESIEELREQLATLQSRLSDYEQIQESQEEANEVEVRTLYSWQSPQRLFVPRSRKWFVYIILIVLLISLILLFFRQFITIAPLLAIAFVAYVLSSVPPEDTEHHITTQGITSSGHSYLWEELADFWFTERSGQTILHIDTYMNFPRRLIILIGNADKEEIKTTLVQFIPYREIPKMSWMDRTADYMAAKFHKMAS
jgi:hypothetical protein